MRIRVGGAAVLAAMVASALGAGTAQAGDAKYALTKGCFALREDASGKFLVKTADGYAATAADAGAAEPLRFQATALGRYLLMDKAGSFVVPSSDGSAGTSATPGPSADLAFDDDAQAEHYVLTALSGPKLGSGTWSTVPAQGCGTFPEAEVNVSGEPSTGATPFSEARGFVDAHMHGMAFEFLGGDVHCGRPWSPYGITVALKQCNDPVIGNQGTNATETVLGGGSPTDDPIGWPTFKDWPAWDKLAHETNYYKWIERAYRSGLRIFVNLFVENAALCKTYPQKHNSCNEMSSVYLQSRDLKALQDYVDAQEGGPGKGWFRIVSDPFEARRVINSGKLAVVPGIEVSSLFDCGLRNDRPTCTREDVDRQLAAVRRAGVRQLELINKFDNAFGGVAGDEGTTGYVVNFGNFTETGRWWDMRTCTGPPEEHDREQLSAPGMSRDALIGQLYGDVVPPGTAPVYPEGPNCNAKGLSSLGEHLVTKLMDTGMLVDPDHLSVLARKRLLDLVEARRYAGILSSHSWSDGPSYPRVLRLGGFVAPYAGASTSFVEEWRKLKPQRNTDFPYGLGWGADMNGFGHQGPPRADAAKNPVVYPFRSWDGRQTIDRNVAGQRTWDLNVDGVAQYGQYPDWVEDLRKITGGDEIVRDLSYGPEAYLDMWERAVGIKSLAECRAQRLRFTPSGLALFRLGAEAEEVLRGAGQPVRRPGRTWSYCVGGRERRATRLKVVFDPAGRASFIASSAVRHRISGIGRGSSAARVRGARRVAPGLLVRRAGRGTSYVFGVRGGKVRFTAVASDAVVRSAASLRGYVRRAGL